MAKQTHLNALKAVYEVVAALPNSPEKDKLVLMINDAVENGIAFDQLDLLSRELVGTQTHRKIAFCFKQCPPAVVELDVPHGVNPQGVAVAELIKFFLSRSVPGITIERAGKA